MYLCKFGIFFYRQQRPHWYFMMQNCKCRFLWHIPVCLVAWVMQDQEFQGSVSAGVSWIKKNPNSGRGSYKTGRKPNSNTHPSSNVPPHGKVVFNWIQEDWLEEVQMGFIPVNYTLPAFLGSLKGQLNIKAFCSLCHFQVSFHIWTGFRSSVQIHRTVRHNKKIPKWT